MYYITKYCCSPTLQFFSCSNWSMNNPSFILGGKRHSSFLAWACSPRLLVFSSFSLQRLDGSFESACSETGWATRFQSLKQCNISLALGSERRRKPQNENRAGGSWTQILWPRSCSKAREFYGAQRALGPRQGPARACCSSCFVQALEFLFETKVDVFLTCGGKACTWRGRWESPRAGGMGHSCLLDPRWLLVLDFSLKALGWVSSHPLAFFWLAKQTKLLKCLPGSHPSQSPVHSCQPPACFVDARARHDVLAAVWRGEDTQTT